MFCRKLKSAVVLSLFCFAAASTVHAASLGTSRDPSTPVNVYPGGEFAGETAQWWHWAHSIPSSTNPIAEDGAVNCAAGQSGDVWFLGGTNGGTADRTCSIAHGKALFFPLLNIEHINGPGDCGHTSGCTVDEKRVQVDGVMDMACNLAATLDGKPTLFSYPTVRVQSTPYSIVIGADDIFGIPAGVTDRQTIAEGYWVYIPSLTPGMHDLQFQGAACDPTTHEPFFATDVTYHINAR